MEDSFVFLNRYVIKISEWKHSEYTAGRRKDLKHPVKQKSNKSDQCVNENIGLPLNSKRGLE